VVAEPGSDDAIGSNGLGTPVESEALPSDCLSDEGIAPGSCRLEVGTVEAVDTPL
jgi:hypothetical protein